MIIIYQDKAELESKVGTAYLNFQKVAKKLSFVEPVERDWGSYHPLDESRSFFRKLHRYLDRSCISIGLTEQEDNWLTRWIETPEKYEVAGFRN